MSEIDWIRFSKESIKKLIDGQNYLIIFENGIGNTVTALCSWDSQNEIFKSNENIKNYKIKCDIVNWYLLVEIPKKELNE